MKGAPLSHHLLNIDVMAVIHTGARSGVSKSCAKRKPRKEARQSTRHLLSDIPPVTNPSILPFTPALLLGTVQQRLPQPPAARRPAT